ncbi:MAG: hypothetical protein JW947_05490 [Sedimentisphaerales bacterium]|nr:hypothetical protein [Sedimentisphaerales bacterium]
MAIKRQFVSAVAFTFIILSQIARADNFYKEMRLIGGYSDKDKWVGEKGESMNSLGFEYYKKFSNEYGDFLTLDLQLRVAYDSMTSSEDAFGVEIHNAWLEHKFGLGQSVRVGHFAPAFGLEPVVDTHGTLLQTLAEQNIGFKRDWGIDYRGLLGDYDFEFAAQLGSGRGIHRKDGSFLLTNRISTPKSGETQVGLSFLYGQTLESSQPWTIPSPDLATNKSIRKRRIGLDLQRPLGIFDFKAEVAAGDDDGKTVAGGLTEFGYTVPQQQNLIVKMQISYWSNEWDKKNARDLILSPVVEYKVNSASTISLGYFHDVYSSSDKDRMVVLQFYYFGL